MAPSQDDQGPCPGGHRRNCEYALAQIKRSGPGQATDEQLGPVHEMLEAWPKTNAGYGRGPVRVRAKMLGVLTIVYP